MGHIEPEKFELYALGRLPEAEAAPLEEHLLVCHQCQDELVRLDGELARLKAALERQNPNT